jgi:hypothetical protein
MPESCRQALAKGLRGQFLRAEGEFAPWRLQVLSTQQLLTKKAILATPPYR